MNLEIQSLRDLAEGQPCMFEVPGVCIHDPSTTVWCHSNEQRHGKGRGIKAHDCFGAFGCSACHHWYDEDRSAARSEKAAVFREAFERTLIYLWARGLIGVVRRGTAKAGARQGPTLALIPKILPRRPVAGPNGASND